MSEAIAAATEETTVETPAAPVPLDQLEDVSEYRARRLKGEGLEVEAPDATPKETPKAAEGEAAKADDKPAEQPDADAGKKKRTAQERIDEITREKYEIKRQADAEIARLRAELEAKSKLSAEPPKAGEAAKEPEKKPEYLTRPKPLLSDFDGVEDSYAAWVEAVADWKADEKIAAREIASAQAAAQRAHQEASERVRKAGQDARSDFDAVFEAFAAAGHKFSPGITEAILYDPLGHELAYALAKDPQENTRLAALEGQPARLFLELGKVFARLASATTGTATETQQETKAPEPIKPVGNGGTVASASDPADINSVAEWRKVRNKFTR